LEELGWLDVKNGCELADDIKPHRRDGPLYAADVCAINLGIVGQLLLRDFPLVPQPTKIRCKKLA
jgi:hypothetical protein